MKAIFDRHIVDPEKKGPLYHNRGFNYGDGLFETIICNGEEIRFLTDHYNRLATGARAMSLVLPDYFTADYLEKQIHRLIQENRFEGQVRIKLLVWRKTGGFYEPSRHDTHHLIAGEKIIAGNREEISRAGICTRVFNTVSPWSPYKTLSSISYVLAGIEKQERDLEDIILLDTKGNVSELLYSNIFWIRNKTFYTPSMETGCIGGVMRTCLMRGLGTKGINVMEVMEPPQVVMEADHIFSANVRGLVHITGIDNISFDKYPELNLISP
jgi:branched-chain amino acid aminotransferase/4-amino-4-deoxychorismate lyase